MSVIFLLSVRRRCCALQKYQSSDSAERGHMEINAFAEKVCKAVKNKLGEDYRVEVKKVRKNNGVIHYGLVILSKGQNVAPTIYLDAFLEAYERGSTFGMLVRRLLALYEAGMPETNVNLEFFRSFEKVKDRICYRLAGRKGNGENE